MARPLNGDRATVTSRDGSGRRGRRGKLHHLIRTRRPRRPIPRPTTRLPTNRRSRPLRRHRLPRLLRPTSRPHRLDRHPRQLRNLRQRQALPRQTGHRIPEPLIRQLQHRDRLDTACPCLLRRGHRLHQPRLTSRELRPHPSRSTGRPLLPCLGHADSLGADRARASEPHHPHDPRVVTPHDPAPAGPWTRARPVDDPSPHGTVDRGSTEGRPRVHRPVESSRTIPSRGDGIVREAVGLPVTGSASCATGAPSRAFRFGESAGWWTLSAQVPRRCAWLRGDRRWPTRPRPGSPEGGSGDDTW